jgi:hypothetical protein
MKWSKHKEREGMMSTIDMVLILAGLTGWLFVWRLWGRFVKSTAVALEKQTSALKEVDALVMGSRVVLVEEYQVEIVAHEGFKKLHLRFQDGTGRTYRFEMHPAYAHHFSDDVLSKVAMAMKPEMG